MAAAQHLSLFQSAMSHGLDVLLERTVQSISFLTTIFKEENGNIFFQLTKISHLKTCCTLHIKVSQVKRASGK
jgi:hypothetical protein